MHSRTPILLSFIIAATAGYAVVTSWAWPWKAALFPLAIGIPVFCLATAEVVWGLLGRHAQQGEDAKDFQLSAHLPGKEALRRTAIAIAWMLGFFATIVLLGFPIAVPLFVFLYLKVQGREGWLYSAIFTLVVWACFYGLFDRVLHLPFPDGWIQTSLHLVN